MASVIEDYLYTGIGNCSNTGFFLVEPLRLFQSPMKKWFGGGNPGSVVRDQVNKSSAQNCSIDIIPVNYSGDDCDCSKPIIPINFVITAAVLNVHGASTLGNQPLLQNLHYSTTAVPVIDINVRPFHELLNIVKKPNPAHTVQIQNPIV